jgi:hypothetical protein
LLLCGHLAWEAIKHRFSIHINSVSQQLANNPHFRVLLSSSPPQGFMQYSSPIPEICQFAAPHESKTNSRIRSQFPSAWCQKWRKSPSVAVAKHNNLQGTNERGTMSHDNLICKQSVSLLYSVPAAAAALAFCYAKERLLGALKTTSPKSHPTLRAIKLFYASHPPRNVRPVHGSTCRSFCICKHSLKKQPGSPAVHGKSHVVFSWCVFGD